VSIFGQSSAVRQLHEGMRLFHDGQRALAVPILDGVLGMQNVQPAHAMAAAGLIAETYRGEADYQRAAQYYELCQSEGAKVPARDRIRSEWYRHYHPRSVLGLAMVMRRSISSDHRALRRMLEELQREAPTLGAVDLPAQIDVVFALYERQRGDTAAAASRLARAVAALAKSSPPFTFLAPDHASALLCQTQALIPEARFSANRRAAQLAADALVHAWSKAVATAVQLHVMIHGAFRDGYGGQGVSASIGARIEQAIGVLVRCANEDGDPFLATEAGILRGAWAALRGAALEVEDALTAVGEVLDRLPCAPAALCVLRAAEAARLGEACPRGRTSSAIARLNRLAQEHIVPVAAAAKTYGVTLTLALDSREPATSSFPLDWLDGPLRALRMLAWP